MYLPPAYLPALTCNLDFGVYNFDLVSEYLNPFVPDEDPMLRKVPKDPEEQRMSRANSEWHPDGINSEVGESVEDILKYKLDDRLLRYLLGEE